MNRDQYADRLWKQINEKYFNSSLTKPVIKFEKEYKIRKDMNRIGKGVTVCGAFCIERKPTVSINSKFTMRDPLGIIEISECVIHEAIHHYVWHHYGWERSDHGPIYQKIHKKILGRKYT